MESSGESDAEELDDSSKGTSQLDQFRAKWQAELQDRKTSPIPKSETASSARSSPALKRMTNKEARQKEAEELFMNGVWSEQNGLIYEAMEYYRKATKIVPDIDLQMAAQYRQSIAQAGNSDAAGTGDHNSSASMEGTEEWSLADLCSNFTQLCSDSSPQRTMYCSMEKPQKSTHISALPSELLTYILRWVVSSDVDVRSLEQLSMVCRGFYVLARDPFLWQSICNRTWGMGCLTFQPYSSWRSMYLDKPHLYFHGVYMNKVELYRKGEVTVEKFYPPWMKVIYYRYLRFFPDGMMFMYTSSSDPVTVISQLKSSTAKVEGMCKGMYRLADDQVSCILKRVKRKEKTTHRYKRNRNATDSTDPEMTFYLDMSLHCHSSQPNSLLKWEKYSVSMYRHDTQSESVNDFQLTKQDFPACKFARVKNYTSESFSPLLGTSK
ncbi:F-box only protein 9-like [Watersipora subatra]|uniref:F-box only protein 9-like n=1 Tax=Watersipora subatra TaxID=2589382 RepID=UPI00355C6476